MYFVLLMERNLFMVSKILLLETGLRPAILIYQRTDTRLRPPLGQTTQQSTKETKEEEEKKAKLTKSDRRKR
jgi:hypothetical protein